MKNRSLAVVFGIVLVIVGALFLAGSFFPVLSMAKLWPLFLLVPIIFFIPPLFESGKSASGVVIPGTILLFLTVYFLVLNYTSWDYISVTWPNFLLAPAVGLFFFYLLNRGQKGLWVPVVILTGLAAVFYGMTLKSNIAIAACFIVLGVVVLIGSIRKNPAKK